MGFSNDFLWGAASAAHQVEGAYNEDGKGLGIWDVLYEGHTNRNENGKVSCDHYHHMKEDVALMKEIGLKSYRFSISWPRVMPEAGMINEKGLEFYSSLVDELVQSGIEPMVTLFHWNLPMWMHEKGGWENEEIVSFFCDYTKAVVEKLSDRVTYWMTLNEPQMFSTLGYVSGEHAPFLQKPEMIGAVTRNAMLCHGNAVKIIRALAAKKPKVGMAPTGNGITPLGNKEEDIEFAKALNWSDKTASFGNDWWQDVMILGQVPKALQPVISEEDLKTIVQPLDFCGYNIYQSMNYSGMIPNPNMYEGVARTAMGWAVTPEIIYWMTKFMYERYQLPILITENGMANCDWKMMDGTVHDPQRTDFIHRYLCELKKAVDEGIPVIGYTYWSFMDNYEWAEGYDKRFGLVYVDYRTQERTLKDSAKFYAEVIANNGENL
ncbi:MAG: family 1 glycosylhydrolase [Eubacteriales bacterium]|nr:family 1 glycosylhydrolase [Eubacteriales bacterium]